MRSQRNLSQNEQEQEHWWPKQKRSQKRELAVHAPDRLLSKDVMVELDAHSNGRGPNNLTACLRSTSGNGWHEIRGTCGNGLVSGDLEFMRLIDDE